MHVQDIHPVQMNLHTYNDQIHQHDNYNIIFPKPANELSFLIFVFPVLLYLHLLYTFFENANHTIIHSIFQVQAIPFN